MSETKMRITVPIGDNKIEIEAAGLKPLLMATGFFANIPSECGNCKSGNLLPCGHKNQDLEFYSVVCKECGHSVKFGQRKSDGGLFLKLDEGWHPPYQKGEGGNRQQGGGGGGSDEIPFGPETAMF
jgi:hypothetical protein